MGIRVNKCIGYGVSNVIWQKVDKYRYKLNDPRFDLASYEGFWDREDEWYLNPSEFWQWCQDHIDELAEVMNPIDFNTRKGQSTQDAVLSSLHMVEFAAQSMGAINAGRFSENMKRHNISDTHRFGEEGGMREVFHISPFAQRDWRRHDETIDWCEETRFHEQTNRFESLGPFGIYPYMGSMVRYRGETLAEDQYPENYMYSRVVAGKMDNSDFSMMIGTWDKKQKPIVTGAALKDLQDNWRCSLPVDITAQLLLLGYIKDVQEFVNELRPMLYVHWC